MKRLIDPIEEVDVIEEKSRRVLVWGAFLLLCGLATGAVIPFVENPRMALAAHLTAVQCAILLLIMGLAWHRLKLSERALWYTYVINVTGALFLWLSFLTSAFVGAEGAAPIAADGHTASATWEAVLKVTTMTGALLSFVGAFLFFWGLELTTWRKR